MDKYLRWLPRLQNKFNTFVESIKKSHMTANIHYYQEQHIAVRGGDFAKQFNPQLL